MTKNEYFTLSNGIEIPKIGFGTWQAKDGEEAYQAVLWALQAGYRHIDTAYVYENESSVAKAIKDSGISREEIFITTKLPAHIKSYQETFDYFEKSLDNLKTTYIDLYLIHAPWPWDRVGEDCTEGNIAAWKAMIQLYQDKKIRSIGVSNFQPQDMEALIQATGWIPHVNQIRFFVGNTQEHIVTYCENNNILIEAYSPFATGKLLENSLLLAMADKYKVSVPQLCLRYCLDRNTLPLPKSVHEQRIYDNLAVDFALSKEDISILNTITVDDLKRPLRS